MAIQSIFIIIMTSWFSSLPSPSTSSFPQTGRGAFKDAVRSKATDALQGHPQAPESSRHSTHISFSPRCLAWLSRSPGSWQGESSVLIVQMGRLRLRGEEWPAWGLVDTVCLRQGRVSVSWSNSNDQDTCWHGAGTQILRRVHPFFPSFSFQLLLFPSLCPSPLLLSFPLKHWIRLQGLMF